MADQPMPTTGGQDVTPVARERFLAMLLEREVKGIETYGTTLQTANGRNVFQDAMEEAIDLWQYLTQAQMEHDALLVEIGDLSSRLEMMTARADHAEAERERMLQQLSTAQEEAIHFKHQRNEAQQALAQLVGGAS